MTDPFAWTEERVARLKELWADPDKSATTIAAEFGCTRSSVLGKAHRLQLPKRRDPSAPRPLTPRPRKAREETLVIPQTQVEIEKPPAEDPGEWRGGPVPGDLPEPFAPVLHPPTPVDQAPPAEGEGIRIEQLEQYLCKWPKGDPQDWERFRYCGKHSKPGSSYCEHHHEKAFVPVPVRARRGRS